MPYRTLLIFTFVSIAAGALLLRCVAVVEPLGIDQSLWASAVRGMARGQLLYRDVWEQRPPGIYWIYLAGFQLLGWTSATVVWLDVIASAATTVLIGLVARALRGALAGAAAAALFAALTMPAWLYRYSGFLERSVSETFIVLAVAMSVWCAVRLRERPSIPLAFAVGVFAGAAVALKPNAGLYLPAVLLWTALYRGEAWTRARLLRGLLVAVVASALVPMAVLAWLWRLDLLGEAAIAVVDFNRYYIAEGFTLGGYALAFSRAVWLRMKTEPLWMAGAAGALAALWQLARTRRLPPLAGLAVVWGATAALVIVVNGARLYNSYFIQALPPLALLSTWFLASAAHGSAGRRAVGAATVALMLVLLVQRSYPSKVLGSALVDLEQLLGRADRVAYLERFGGYANNRGYSARANEELAAYVRAHTGPDDRIFLFGINGAGVYFAADRLTAHRFLRVNFFVNTTFPDSRFRLEAVTAELAERRPRYLIFERLHAVSDMGRAADSVPEQPAVIELLRGYRLDTQIEDFTLYRRLE